MSRDLQTLVLASLTISMLGGSPASAQSSRTTDPLSTAVREAAEAPLEVSLTPYVWAISLHGNTSVAGVDADVDVDFNDLVKHLNGAVMLEAELRKGDFGLIFDGFYANLSDDDASGDDRIKIDAEANQAVLQAAGTYRIGTFTLADGDETGPITVTVDPYVGARYTYLELDLKGRLDFPRLGRRDTRSVDSDKHWTDPIAGLRTIWSLDDRFEFVLAGDAGGTSPSSQYSWQTFAIAGYRFGLFGDDNARLLAGYRALHQKFEDGSGRDEFEWDVTMHGPILGLSVSF